MTNPLTTHKSCNFSLSHMQHETRAQVENGAIQSRVLDETKPFAPEPAPFFLPLAVWDEAFAATATFDWACCRTGKNANGAANGAEISALGSLRGRRSSSGPFGVLPRASTPACRRWILAPVSISPGAWKASFARQRCSVASRGAPPTRENAHAKYNLRAAARLRVRGNAARPHEGSVIVLAALQIFDPPLAASWLVKAAYGELSAE